MGHHAQSAGPMYSRKSIFLRRMPALFVATRLFWRIGKQIFLESGFYVRGKTVHDQPSCEVRSGENFSVSIFCYIVIANFNADAAEVFQNPAIALIAPGKHPTEKISKLFVLSIYAKPEQMKLVKTNPRFNAQFDAGDQTARAAFP